MVADIIEGTDAAEVANVGQNSDTMDDLERAELNTVGVGETTDSCLQQQPAKDIKR